MLIFFGLNKVPPFWKWRRRRTSHFITHLFATLWHGSNFVFVVLGEKLFQKKIEIKEIDRMASGLSMVSSYYWGDQCVSIDEQSIDLKGHYRCKVFNPHKTHKLNIFFLWKTVSWDISITFLIRQGQNDKRPENKAATSYPIKRFHNFARFLHKGIILFMDIHIWESENGWVKGLLDFRIE